MIRYFILRLAVIPPALLLVHFLGFAYAHLVRPLRALRNPYLAGVSDTSPLWPAYTSHLERILRFEFTPIANPWGGRLEIPMGEALTSAGAASFGLLAIALMLSITAEPAWTVRLGDRPEKFNGGVLVSGGVYAATEEGHLYLIGEN